MLSSTCDASLTRRVGLVCSHVSKHFINNSTRSSNELLVRGHVGLLQSTRKIFYIPINGLGAYKIHLNVLIVLPNYIELVQQTKFSIDNTVS